MNKWIHVIGIAGVATSAVAVMFKKSGWKVTGSDKAFFPPTSLYLNENDIEVNVGFDSAHLYNDKAEMPSLVMYQGNKDENNPEFNEAVAKKLDMRSLAEVISDYIICDESIVVTGTYGKTTITSILSAIFQHSNKNISYMYAGVPSENITNAKLKDHGTEYSVVEGDEYIISQSNRISKFFLYKPKYLLINSIKHEHLDVFETEIEYINNFHRLAENIPLNGFIVANANDKNVVEAVKDVKSRVIFYSVDVSKAFVEPLWMLTKESKPLPALIRKQDKYSEFEIIPIEKNIIGDFNFENILAATAMAYEFKIRKERIQESIKLYTGLKRRLEILFKKDQKLIISDLGSSPPKASGALETLAKEFPEHKIIAVIDPNAGNRVTSALPLFDNVFNDIYKLYIPRFARIPKNSQICRFYEKDLYQRLKNNDVNVDLVLDDEQLVRSLQKDFNSFEKVVIVFLSSHNLRGIDKMLISNL